MSGINIPEELIAFLHAIMEDDDMCLWLLGLEKLSLTGRSGLLQGLAAEMKQAGEAEDVVAAISALARPALYDAACQTLRELRERKP